MMTPGPTELPERVRSAMERQIQNPDVDKEFPKFYHDLEKKLSKVYGTDDDVLILGGEGILGLEASVNSLIQKDDDALCISNGIYGEEFADFVEMYGGNPLMCKSGYGQRIDFEKIKSPIEKNDPKIATMVHCDTPTGNLNDLEKILQILKDNEIITVVDAVSSLGGTPVPTENMDICIGGSQKCFSSPPGLTTLSVSDEAWEKISNNEQNSLYTSLAPWKEMWIEKEIFPYTHLVTNLYGLEESLNIILKEGMENVFNRHQNAAEICRKRGSELGLELFPEIDLSSPTVTAFHTKGKALEIKKRMREDHDILIATSLKDLKNEVIRIGHMGHNADLEKVKTTMRALGKTLEKLDM